MKQIAFIGIGVMGGGMAANLIRNRYALNVYTRTREKAQAVVDMGARWCGSIAQAVAAADAVITMVGYPSDVEQVYFGAEGIIENAQPGAYLIDMTTTSPALSTRIYAAARQKGLRALDAPVSGGDTGAKNATLSIMVGADKADFDACLPLLGHMGQNIVHQGGPGAGQHAKMANQIAIAGAIAGVCEALTYAQRAGLDAQTLLQSISAGAAGSWQMSNNAPRMLAGDDAPGFYIKHFIKDMGIADEEARSRALTLPVLQKALALYQEMAQQGMGDLGTQALIRHYENM